MTHQEKKLFRIGWIMARVAAAAKKNIAIDEEKLLAEFCLFFGAGQRYAKEYLKELEAAGKIVRAVGMILTPKQYKSDTSMFSKIKSRILRKKQ